MGSRRRLGAAGRALPVVLAAVLAVLCATMSPSAQGLSRRMPLDQLKRLAPGKFLVAARDLLDPNFAATVVLLFDYSSEGAAGLIVNRRTEVPLSDLFKDLSLGVNASLPAHVGGPVARTSVLAFTRAGAPIAGAQPVTGDVYLISTRDPLARALATNVNPDRLRIYLGYSGWGEGQLDREITSGAWHVFDADPDLVFDPNPETIWRRLIRLTELQQAD